MPVLAVHLESTLCMKVQVSALIVQLALTVEMYNLYAVLSVPQVATLHQGGDGVLALPSQHPFFCFR